VFACCDKIPDPPRQSQKDSITDPLSQDAKYGSEFQVVIMKQTLTSQGCTCMLDAIRGFLGYSILVIRVFGSVHR